MSTANERAEQRMDDEGGAPLADGEKHARRAMTQGRPRDRLRRRRRWPIVATALAALAALLAPPPSNAGVAGKKVHDAAQDRSLSQEAALKLLSTGAPKGAMILPAAPAQSGSVQPVVSTAISGLAANGIPNVALNAYRVAALRMNNAMPSCGIDWSLLAGIGRVESNHGRFGGATLAPDGTSSPRIIGPALNGGQFAFIRDTDNGSWDGDTVTDRAVGPMQFIPATWRSYAISADPNRPADPFNINDAALAAAHYLCVAGGNLTTADGQRQAVLAYNHSDSYVAEVLALARAYAAGIPVADLPISGDTNGAVPAPDPTYAYAPASPGPAIGASDSTPASGDTVGAQPSATAQPAAQPAAQPDAQPAANEGPSAGQPGTGSSGGGTPVGDGTPTGTGTSPGGTPTGGTPPGDTSAGSPAPLPVPVPAPVPVPVPPAPAPVPRTLPPALNPITKLPCNLAGYSVTDPTWLPCPVGTLPPVT
jgi:membrane-bound lytic murein transglycosylase B